MLAPVELYSALINALQEDLEKGALALVQYAKNKPWVVATKSPPAVQVEEEDDKILEALGDVYFNVFEPFVLRALSEGVYGKPLGSDVGPLTEAREKWEAMFNPHEAVA